MLQLQAVDNSNNNETTMMLRFLLAVECLMI